jgi:hypothetical protein
MVSTWDTKHQAIIDTNNTDIFINITFGAEMRFRAHPLQQQVTLRAGQCGPLEITLFLKIKLPQTNVGTYGKFVIIMKPGLIIPS